MCEKGEVNLLGSLYSYLDFSRALFVMCKSAIFNTAHNTHTSTATSLISHLLDSDRKSLALHSYKNVFITTIALACLHDHKPENSPVMRRRHIICKDLVTGLLFLGEAPFGSKYNI